MNNISSFGVALLLCSFSLCQKGMAQVVDVQHNNYRYGDNVKAEPLDATTFCLDGVQGVWSVEDASPIGKPFFMKHEEEFGQSMVIKNGQRFHYFQEPDGIYISGRENPLEKVDYSMPEHWLKFPMHVGDSVVGYFCGTGKYCDHLSVRRFGRYSTKADVQGCLVLPSGDTLRSVMRIHTERVTSIHYAPIDTLGQDVHVFNVDSIVKCLAEDSLILHEDIYRWYARGYRYPILEASVSQVDDEQKMEELLFIAPSDQERLPLDEENKSIRENSPICHAEGQGEAVATGTLSGLTYQITSHDLEGHLSFSYQSLSQVSLSYGLYSIDGQRVYWQQQRTIAPGAYCDVIDVSHVKSGIYALNIYVNGERAEEKISVNH